MTMQKINLTNLATELDAMSRRQRTDRVREVVLKAYKQNINDPETELVFARNLRAAISDGEFQMHELEEEVVDAWVVPGRAKYGEDRYWREYDTRSDLEVALAQLFHFDLAKRFVSFAKKAISENKKLAAEKARREKVLSRKKVA